MERVWLSPQEAGEYLGISRATIYRWVREGKIALHKVGKVSRIKKEDLDQLMEEGRES